MRWQQTAIHTSSLTITFVVDDVPDVFLDEVAYGRDGVTPCSFSCIVTPLHRRPAVLPTFFLRPLVRPLGTPGGLLDKCLPVEPVASRVFVDELEDVDPGLGCCFVGGSSLLDVVFLGPGDAE